MKTTKEKHSPTPWIIKDGSPWEVLDARGAVAFDDGSACGEYGARCPTETRDFIVLCVNTHGEARDAIRAALDAMAERTKAVMISEARGTDVPDLLPAEIEAEGKLRAVLAKMERGNG